VIEGTHGCPVPGIVGAEPGDALGGHAADGICGCVMPRAPGAGGGVWATAEPATEGRRRPICEFVSYSSMGLLFSRWVYGMLRASDRAGTSL